MAQQPVNYRLKDRFAGLSILASLVALCMAASPSAHAESADWQHCRTAAYALEDMHNTPPAMLAAISLTETGRRGPNGRLEAWPWTINAEGRGYYFTSKAEAIRAVRRLMAQGKRSIDVGCMQINLRFHPRAFTSLEEAFDPSANMSYAVAFLSDLRTRTSSWEGAVGNYHSYSPELNQRYIKRVSTLWDKERKRGRIKIARATRPEPPVQSASNHTRPAVPSTQAAQTPPSEEKATPTGQRRYIEAEPVAPAIITADQNPLRSSFAEADIQALRSQGTPYLASASPALEARDIPVTRALLHQLHARQRVAAR